MLVADDDEDVRNLVQRRVQQAGHRVGGSASAEEALAVVAERGAPELVVLDVASTRLGAFDKLLGQAQGQVDGSW